MSTEADDDDAADNDNDEHDDEPIIPWVARAVEGLGGGCAAMSL